MKNPEAAQYDALTAPEIATIIIALRDIDARGLRKTVAEQSFILRGLSSPKLVAVARLLPRTLEDVLSGRDVAVVEGQ
jgi:hypothetical protein